MPMGNAASATALMLHPQSWMKPGPLRATLNRRGADVSIRLVCQPAVGGYLKQCKRRAKLVLLAEGCCPFSAELFETDVAVLRVVVRAPRTASRRPRSGAGYPLASDPLLTHIP